jgi:hypothetical protein
VTGEQHREEGDDPRHERRHDKEGKDDCLRNDQDEPEGHRELVRLLSSGTKPVRAGG